MFKKSALIFVMLVVAVEATAETVLYPAVPGMRTSGGFKTRVSGQRRR